MLAAPAAPGPATPLGTLVKRLERLEGCGKSTRGKLRTRFPSSEALLGASVSDFDLMLSVDCKRQIKRRPSLAKDIHDVLHGGEPQGTWGGTERAAMWNTLTMKKLSGAAAPTVDNAEEWLAAHPGYERYSGQDRKQKGPLHVPDDCKMDDSGYAAYSAQPGDEQQLYTNLAEFGLSVTGEESDLLSALVSSAAMHFQYPPQQLRESLETHLGSGIKPTRLERKMAANKVRMFFDGAVP